jgi:hypothetical protein
MKTFGDLLRANTRRIEILRQDQPGTARAKTRTANGIDMRCI